MAGTAQNQFVHLKVSKTLADQTCVVAWHVGPEAPHEPMLTLVLPVCLPYADPWR